MKHPPADAEPRQEKTAPLPIGQHEGEGTNAVQHEHKPDPDAEPIADGKHRYAPRTGYIHGNE